MRLDRVNARIGARRSGLTGPEGLRELLVRGGLPERAEWLVRRGRIAAGGPPEGLLEAIEAGMRALLREEEARLLAEVEGRGARTLLAAALGLGAAETVKGLLRGVARGLPPPALVEATTPSGAIGERELRRLAEAPTPEALADRLEAAGSPLAPGLRAALAGRAKEGLLPAEVAVDRNAAAGVAAAARGRGEDARLLRAWLAERIDRRNATTLLALGEAPTSQDLHLPGGLRIGPDAFGRLARAGAAERRAAAAALVPCDPSRLVDPAAAERLLERAVVARLRRAARCHPLSLAVPLAYLEARREEVRRISLLLRGAEVGLAGEAILDLVEA